MTALARQLYLYGGLRIDSELALTRLAPVARRDAGTAEIELTLARGAAVRGRRIYQWPGRFEMSLWSSDAGWVFHSARMGLDVTVTNDGRQLGCHPGDTETLSEFVIRRVLPRVAQLHGRMTVHAALVLGPHGGVMLAGPSGAGKSTLAAALGTMGGWDQLSDDICLVAPDGCGVWASAPGAYLTPRSMAALGFDADDGAGDPSRSGKAWFHIGAPAPEPLPIAGLVFLDRRSDVRAARLVSISRAEALGSLTPQFIRFDPSDGAAEERLFRSFARVVGAFECYRLEYASDYAVLPSVSGELRKARAHVRV